MATRPDNLETVRLALELLKRIPRHKKITAPELRDQLADIGLERDLRTIQRQLEMLCEHYDIDRDDRSKPYGYSWKKNAKTLSLPTLSEQESVLLTLAEQHLRNLLPASMTRSMDGFFEQARLNLGPGGASKSGREWLKKVRVVSTTQPLLPPKIAPGVFDAVSGALYANHWLDVDYRNVKGDQKPRRVMPLGLAQQGPRMYLVARFEGYENERSLALHRMVKATDTGLPFERPSEFDLQKFDDDGRFGFGSGKRIKLVFWIKRLYGEHILESKLSEDQSFEVDGEGYRISATVIESDQLRWWLRSLGDVVTVISPPGLLQSN